MEFFLSRKYLWWGFRHLFWFSIFEWNMRISQRCFSPEHHKLHVLNSSRLLQKSYRYLYEILASFNKCMNSFSSVPNSLRLLPLHYPNVHQSFFLYKDVDLIISDIFSASIITSIGWRILSTLRWPRCSCNINNSSQPSHCIWLPLSKKSLIFARVLIFHKAQIYWGCFIIVSTMTVDDSDMWFCTAYVKCQGCCEEPTSKHFICHLSFKLNSK